MTTANLYLKYDQANKVDVKFKLVQWHDPIFSSNLAWSINNHFYAFFNSF